MRCVRVCVYLVTISFIFTYHKEIYSLTMMTNTHTYAHTSSVGHGERAEDESSK